MTVVVFVKVFQNQLKVKQQPIWGSCEGNKDSQDFYSIEGLHHCISSKVINNRWCLDQEKLIMENSQLNHYIDSVWNHFKVNWFEKFFKRVKREWKTLFKSLFLIAEKLHFLCRAEVCYTILNPRNNVHFNWLWFYGRNPKFLRSHRRYFLEWLEISDAADVHKLRFGILPIIKSSKNKI